MSDIGTQARITKPPKGPGWKKAVKVLRWKGKGVTRCEGRVERKVFKGRPELEAWKGTKDNETQAQKRDGLKKRLAELWQRWKQCLPIPVKYLQNTVLWRINSRSQVFCCQQRRQGTGELRVALCCGCYRQSLQARLQEITRNHINELKPSLPLFGN